MRSSKQRDLVYEVVKSCGNHPTADMIYTKAREVMPNISLGTVYRNLSELQMLGKLIKVVVPGDSDHYDHTISEHSHLCCKVCKCVTDILINDMTSFINKIELDNHVKILSNQISLIGVCPKCQNN